MLEPASDSDLGPNRTVMKGTAMHRHKHQLVICTLPLLLGVPSFSAAPIPDQLRDHLTIRAEGMALKEHTIQSIENHPDIKSEVTEQGFIQIKELPGPGGNTQTATLKPIDVLSDTFTLRIHHPNGSIETLRKPDLPEVPLFLSGHSSEDNSLVFLAIKNGKPTGFIDSPDGRILLADETPNHTAEDALLEEHIFQQMIDQGYQPCNTIASPNAPIETEQGGLAHFTSPPQCIEIPINIFSDNEHVNNTFNGNTGMWYGWCVHTIAATAAIYHNQVNIRLVLENLVYWNNTTDPFDEPVMEDQLLQFANWCKQQWSDQGALYGLISGRPFGAGGQAYRPGILDGYPYFIVAASSTTEPVPEPFKTGNRDLLTIVHEIGHNLGAIHTHEYCPPLDTCAPTNFFGSCQNSQNCQVGTIMSYCGQCFGGMSNVRFQFHPDVRSSIVATIAKAPGLREVSPLPVAVDDIAETMMNEPVIISPFENDLAGCKPFYADTFDAVSTHGGQIVASGSNEFGNPNFLYIPPPAFVGTDSFTYTIDPTFPSSVGTVTITVTDQFHELDSILLIDESDDSIKRYSRRTGFYQGILVPSGYGGLIGAQSISVTPHGNIAVSSTDSDEILHYHSRTGRFMGIYYADPTLNGPRATVFDGLRMYAVGGASSNVHVTSVTQGLLDILDDSELLWPNDITLGNNGSIWVVTNNIEKPVQNWNPNTETMLAYVPGTTEDWPTTVAYFDQPSDWGVPPYMVGRNIYVIDRAAYTLKAYNADTGVEIVDIIPFSFFDGFNLGALSHVHTDEEGLIYVSHDNGLFRYDVRNDWTIKQILDETDGVGKPGDFAFLPEQTHRTGDLNLDFIINGVDLAILLGEFNSPGFFADLDGDGLVDGRDLSLLLGNWGPVQKDDEGDKDDG